MPIFRERPGSENENAPPRMWRGANIRDANIA